MERVKSQSHKFHRWIHELEHGDSEKHCFVRRLGEDRSLLFFFLFTGGWQGVCVLGQFDGGEVAFLLKNKDVVMVESHHGLCFFGKNGLIAHAVNKVYGGRRYVRGVVVGCMFVVLLLCSCHVLVVLSPCSLSLSPTAAAD